MSNTMAWAKSVTAPSIFTDPDFESDMEMWDRKEHALPYTSDPLAYFVRDNLMEYHLPDIISYEPQEEDIALAAWRVEQVTTLEVRRLAGKWAGLRSFLPDRQPVARMDFGDLRGLDCTACHRVVSTATRSATTRPPGSPLPGRSRAVPHPGTTQPAHDRLSSRR